jgi:hypothetical protein
VPLVLAGFFFSCEQSNLSFIETGLAAYVMVFLVLPSGPLDLLQKRKDSRVIPLRKEKQVQFYRQREHPHRHIKRSCDFHRQNVMSYGIAIFCFRASNVAFGR